MAPPSFSDIGKQARDLFNKQLYAGQWRLQAKTTTLSGNKFTGTHVNNSDNGAALSTLESEFSWPDYGMKVNEKWTTDNQLTTEISIEDQLIKGLKTTFESSFNPSSNKKKGIVKNNFQSDMFNVDLDVNFDYAGPTLKGAAVVGYKGWSAGVSSIFDSPKNLPLGSNVAVGYNGGDFVLSVACKDARDVEASYYHKLRTDLELAVGGAWSTGANITNFNIATKYHLSPDTNVKAKVANNGLVSLALQQKICRGATATLSSSVDLKNFQAGGHRIGLALEVDQ